MITSSTSAVDRLGDRAEVLDLVARHAVGRARVDVDHRRRPRRRSAAPRRRTPRACTGSPGTGRGWRRARDRAGDDDGVLEGSCCLLLDVEHELADGAAARRGPRAPARTSLERIACGRRSGDVSGGDHPRRGRQRPRAGTPGRSKAKWPQPAPTTLTLRNSSRLTGDRRDRALGEADHDQRGPRPPARVTLSSKRSPPTGSKIDVDGPACAPAGGRAPSSRRSTRTTSSAPALGARPRSFSSVETTATTRAPSALPTWIAAVPDAAGGAVDEQRLAGPQRRPTRQREVGRVVVHAVAGALARSRARRAARRRSCGGTSATSANAPPSGASAAIAVARRRSPSPRAPPARRRPARRRA